MLIHWLACKCGEGRKKKRLSCYSLTNPLYVQFLKSISVESLIEHLTNSPAGSRKLGVTNVSGDVVVPSGEDIVVYAKGYYDRAKDILQDCVYELGVISADYKPPSESSGIGANMEAKEGTVELEKEDLAHLATMMIYLGGKLEEYSE